jgi:Protein kinase domain
MSMTNSPEILIRNQTGYIDLVDYSYQARRMARFMYHSAYTHDSPVQRTVFQAGVATAVVMPLYVWTFVVAVNLPKILLLDKIQGILGVLVLLALVPMYVALIRYALTPTLIGLSANGIRFYARNAGLLVDTFNWQDIASIKIVEKSNLFRTVKPELEIRTAAGKIRHIAIASLRSIEERQTLVDMIKQHARRAINPGDINRIVRASAIQDIPFTQLWAQSLRSQIGRTHGGALPSRTVLQQGRFLLSEQIGGGGQGSVYLAEMLEGGEPPVTVALKEYVLPDPEHIFDRKRAVEQFEREVHLLAKLNHPGLVTLIDAFVEDHRAYLVMEYLNGGNLREAVSRSGLFSVERACDIALELCDVLEYLHSTQPQTVHLDVTPENVIFDREGHIHLVDFNTSSDGSGVRTKLIAGKQRYMPPEQYRNEVSPQCDIYGFGCTLFFMLTGIEPEPLSSSEPKQVNSEISDTLNELVKKSTALEATQRFQHISELKNSLIAFKAQPVPTLVQK